MVSGVRKEAPVSVLHKPSTPGSMAVGPSTLSQNLSWGCLEGHSILHAQVLSIVGSGGFDCPDLWHLGQPVGTSLIL